MPYNIIGLAMRITADPTQAVGAIEELQAKTQQFYESSGNLAAESTQAVTAAQEEQVASVMSLRAQYQALADDAAKLEALPFLSGEEAEGLATDRDLMAEIQQEAQGLGATLAEDGQAAGGMMESMQGALVPLRTFRMLMYSTFGLISFGFYITEWGRVVEAIESGVHAMEGFDSAAQKAFADMIKGADDALVHFEGLTLEQRIATGQALIAQTEQRINADIAARSAIQAQSYWHNLAMEIEGVIAAMGGNPAKIAAFGALFGAKSGFTADELQQNNLLQKQFKELIQLEKQERESQKHLEAATLAHGNALAALIGAERDEITQSRIGDNQRRQAIAQYDAEIRKIDQTVEALRRKKQFTETQTREAEEARVLAAQVRDEKLRRLDEAEKAREDKSFEEQQTRQRKYLDKILTGKALQDELTKAANRTAAKGITTGIHGVPVPGADVLGIGATVAAHASEAAGHIDAETRAVWNLQAALLGLGPVIDDVAQKHQNAAKFEDMFASAMGKNIAMAIVYSNSIGAAAEKAMKASIASIAAEAIVRALFAGGYGLLMLAEHDYPAATQAFEAAAVFGAVGGAAAVVARAIPGGAGAAHGAGRAAGVGAGMRSAPGAGAGAMGSAMAPGASSPQYSGGRLTVAVFGEEEAGNWIANTLNQAVETQGTRLVASHTKTSAPVGQ